MEKKSITIAVQCHKFQKRLSFMLSSLVDQNNKDDYDLVFDLAYVEEESFPTNTDIIDYFGRQSINIKARKYDGFDRFQFRGFVRNDQLKDCSTDYMLFADCDMVYHPDFMSKLMKLLTTDDKYIDYGGVMMAGRYSNPIEEANAIVDTEGFTATPYVASSWKLARLLPQIKRRSCGAGYFQLINAKTCKHGGLYVDESSCRDFGWYDGKKNMQKARSDQQFRRRVKIKQQLPSWFHRAQIHLNHERDNQHGFHLETQR
jgi:hypothetical protein